MNSVINKLLYFHNLPAHIIVKHGELRKGEK